MNLYDIVILAILFVVLTPGILLRLPMKGSNLFVAVVHGIVFGVVVFLLSVVFILVKAKTVPTIKSTAIAKYKSGCILFIIIKYFFIRFL